MPLDDVYYLPTLNEARQRAGNWRPPARVLVIQGSPRGERGAAELVAKGLIRGFEEAGAQVRLFRLGGRDMEPCRGCFQCWTGDDGRCPIDDDLVEIIDAIPEYELMVWVTPLYMEGLPGNMKILLDRMMVHNHPAIVLREGRCVHPCRRQTMPDLAVAAVAGFYGEHIFDPLINHLRVIAFDQHTPLRATLLRPDCLSLMHPQGREAWKKVDQALAEAARRLLADGAVPGDLARAVSRPLVSLEQYLELAKKWWKGR